MGDSDANCRSSNTRVTSSTSNHSMVSAINQVDLAAIWIGEIMTALPYGAVSGRPELLRAHVAGLMLRMSPC